MFLDIARCFGGCCRNFPSQRQCVRAGTCRCRASGRACERFDAGPVRRCGDLLRRVRPARRRRRLYRRDPVGRASASREGAPRGIAAPAPGPSPGALLSRRSGRHGAPAARETARTGRPDRAAADRRLSGQLRAALAARARQHLSRSAGPRLSRRARDHRPRADRARAAGRSGPALRQWRVSQAQSADATD